MKILVFTEGTVLKHVSDDRIKDYSSYVPVGGAVEKLTVWTENGAEISYLTSRVKFMEIKQIKDVLKNFDFPGDMVHARQEDETYKQVVMTVKPDLLIEDDCKSIGGEAEMISFGLKSEAGIHVIVVPEFGGIDHLPDNLEELKEFGKKEEVATTRDDTY